MAYTPPGVTSTLGRGANVGGGIQAGLVVALVGSFPTGPAFPIAPLPGTPFPQPFPVPAWSSYLVGSQQQGEGTFGADYTYADPTWSGPPAMRAVYENDRGLTPLVFAVRAGTAQATATLPNGTGTIVWTATSLLELGGGMGNGTTLAIAGTTLTITPGAAAAAAGKAPETYPVPVGTTWAQVAALVNGRSKLVWLNSASLDTVTVAGTTTATLAGGTDGGNATLAQINAAVDAVMAIAYSDQPIHELVPLYADTAPGGAGNHALGAAVAAVARGQRTRVFTCAAPSAGGHGNIAGILAIGTDLIPGENNGDSGRCRAWANTLPYRNDPQTGLRRLFPAYLIPAADAGLSASIPVARPTGRDRLLGFTDFGDGYAFTERLGPSGFYANGMMVVDNRGRMRDQVTTATPSTSFFRDDNVARAADWWIADLQAFLDDIAIEIEAGPEAGQAIDTVTDLRLRTDVEQHVLAGFELGVAQDASDPRAWLVDINAFPIFAVRTITLRIQFRAVPGTGTTAQGAAIF